MPTFATLQQKIVQLLPIFIGLLLAVLIGVNLPANPAAISILLVGITVMVLWIVVFPQLWWVGLPAGAGLGGFFEFAYKIYPSEIAFATALVPLAISIAIRRRGISQGRPPLDSVCYFLIGYLIFHWLGSNYYNKYFVGLTGYGNVLRAYLGAASGIGFICLFNQWGSTRPVRRVLLLIYGVTWIRLILAFYTFFTQSDGFIPVINYSIQSGDLRFSGLTLAILSIGYFSLSSGFVFKMVHLAIFGLSGLAVLAGSSRACLAIYLSIPIWLALINRKYALLWMIASVTAAALCILNFIPSVLEGIDPRIARPLSGGLINQNEAEHYGRTSSSDYWHQRLRQIAFERWTETYANIIFGTGVRRFDDSSVDLDESRDLLNRMESTMKGSASVGAYESGFWTVLAVTGVVGFMLYALVIRVAFISCFKALMKDGITSHAHVFAFFGCVMTGAWIGLFWTYGGYPSLEIMYLFLGKIALEDAERRRQAKDVSSVKSSGLDRTSRARSWIGRPKVSFG